MTEALDTEIQRIKARIAAAQREQAKAQHQRDAAIATVRQSMAELSREFGVTTLEEAQDLLTTLEADLAARIQQLQAELDNATATA